MEEYRRRRKCNKGGEREVKNEFMDRKRRRRRR
jgi:hypothetical protein